MRQSLGDNTAPRSALRSVVNLARNGEADTALDELCLVIDCFAITLTEEQFERIGRLAEHFESDAPEETRLARLVI
ncbi:hypothetical protein QNO07_15720 [Streptomyces sp. 549]|uniref:hypothetical protein n=1 Tax=Streptomyces sp. 549 TaxID=3049076 RepID=UPI0024C2A2AF|nr:hypothetical protein [Streptomyces sp. 549]MDK1474851.1 hypothetical protein [Streptomyces sp. 549]